MLTEGGVVSNRGIKCKSLNLIFCINESVLMGKIATSLKFKIQGDFYESMQ